MTTSDQLLLQKLYEHVEAFRDEDEETQQAVIDVIKKNLGPEAEQPIADVLKNLFEEIDTSDLAKWLEESYHAELNSTNAGGEGNGEKEAKDSESEEKKANVDVGDESDAPKKRSRPAIYDEAERDQKIQDVQKKHNDYKKNNKQQQQNQNQNQRQNHNQHQQRDQPHNRKPAKSPPRRDNEESGKKKSIFDRLTKAPTSLKDKVELIKRNSTHSTDDNAPQKKVKTNDNDNSYPSHKAKPPPKTKQMVQAEQAEKQRQEQKPQNPKQTKPQQKPKADNEEYKEAPADNEGQEQGDNDAIKKYKIRCRNWPACDKKDQCLYVHPSENCKFFPACTAGDKCLYLHPAVPCKFGAACQRPGCSYTHPSFVSGMFRPKRNFSGYGAQGQREQ